MKVVFVENVTNVASAGEVKTVANGYARNYLLPRKLAVPATLQELKRLEERNKAEDRREAKLGAKSGDLATRISRATVVISARTGATGRLYGAVTNTHIAEELARLVGEPIDRRKIRLDEPIRRLGEFELEVHLTKDVTTNVKVIVLGEGKEAAVVTKAETKEAALPAQFAAVAPAQVEGDDQEETEAAAETPREEQL